MRARVRNSVVAGIGLAGAWMMTSTALAGALRVAPVTVDLSSEKRAAVLLLTNTGDKPVDVQLRVFAWSQVHGQDRLEPTRMVVASPPAVTLAPGAQQIVRIVDTGAATGSQEQSYRVLVDELPDLSHRRHGQISMVMRQSVPIFVAAADGRPDISWSLQRDGDALQLVAINKGTRRLRVSDLVISDPNQHVVQQRGGLLGYVLPSATMRWPLDLKQQNAADALTLSVKTDLGPIDAALPPPTTAR